METGFSYNKLLDSFARKQVLVVGDCMLDEYVWGQVRRISPEAPVPVVAAERRSYAPGGAANVAMGVAGLGGRAALGGVVGADHSAMQLHSLLQQRGIRAEGLVVDGERPTTTKTRIVAHSQQVVRVDSERRTPLSAALEDELVEWAANELPAVDACVLSDYDKGVVTGRFAERLMSLARQYSKPVVVDPKGVDYRKYHGATIITPNLQEAERATNGEIKDEADLLKVGKQLSSMLGGSAVLITRGAQGMSLFGGDGEVVHVPTVARNVYDVTGAGDTVVSTLAMTLAAGATLEQAVRLANLAAGIVVGKLGTALVTVEELARESHNMLQQEMEQVSTPAGR